MRRSIGAFAIGFPQTRFQDDISTGQSPLLHAAEGGELPVLTQRQLIRVGPGKRIISSILGWVATVLNLRRRLRGRFKPVQDTSAVLILEPYGMGDVISLEPLIRRLREQKVEIRLAAKAAWRPLYPPSIVSEWLDAGIPWTSYNSRTKYQWSSYWHASFRTCFRELRRLGSGIVGIDPRGDIRSVLLLRLAGCREVFSLESYLGADVRIPSSAATTVPFREDSKRWELNLQFLKLMRISSSPQSLPPRFDHFQTTARTGSARRIGLLPVAPWAGKLWSRERWGELIAHLLSDHWEVRGLGGPQQSSATSHELGGKVPVEECSTIETWAEKLGSLDCLVTVDSGPMHLADALGVPVVALFGQGKLPLWAPSGPRSRVVSHQTDPDFYPCHPIERNAPIGRMFMDRIEVAEVLYAVREVLCHPGNGTSLAVDAR